MRRKKLPPQVMISLPPEVLALIFRFLTQVQNKSTVMKRCCLVCQRWRRLAQPILFEHVVIRRIRALANFYESVMNSRRLGRYVLSFKIEFVAAMQDTYGYLPMRKMLADCLLKTRRLKEFSSSGDSTILLTKKIGMRMCSLPELKKVTIKPPQWGDMYYPSYLNREDDEDSDELTEDDVSSHSPFKKNFTYSCFLSCVSTTVESLVLCKPTKMTLDLLPGLSSNLQRPRCASNASGTVLHLPTNVGNRTTLQPVTGSLSLRSVSPEKLISVFAPSVSSTLTSLSCHASQSAEHEPILTRLLSATPLLENLELSSFTLLPSVFDNVPPLELLRTLRMPSCIGPNDPEWEEFFQSSLPKFLSNSPLLNTFGFGYLYSHACFGDELIDGLIVGTTTQGPVSTLRSLHFGNLGPGWAQPSIEAIEKLCQSAPLLTKFDLKFSTYGLERTVAAIGSLRHLVQANLNSLKFTRPIGGDAINFQPLLDTADDSACSEYDDSEYDDFM